MLTSIRKVQKGVLIVVTVIICIAFAYLYSRYDSGAVGAGNGVAVTVWGQPYRGSEALKIANQLNLAMSDLGFRPPFTVTPIGSFAQQLNFMGREEMNQDRTNYVINLLTLREAARRLGIEAGPEEIQSALEEVDAFRDPVSGEFSDTAVATFVENRMGSRSMGMLELREMIGDFVQFEKAREVIGAGFTPSQWEVDREYGKRYEELTAYEVFVKQPTEEAPEVTDEEISAYYEDNKSTLLSPEKRSVGYIAFPLPERTEDLAEDQWKALRIEEAKAFNQVYKALGEVLDEGVELEQALEQVMAGKEREVVRTEPFSWDSPPAELEGEMELLEDLFRLSPDIEVALGAAETSKAIYLFWLNEHLPPAELTLEEATDEVKRRLEAQKQDQQLNEVADEAREKLVAELAKGGRTFSEVAAAAGLEAKLLKPFTRLDSPEGSEFASTVSAVAGEMQEGELSPPEVVGDGALLIYVADVSLPARESEPEDKKRLADSLQAQASSQAFTAWFLSQRELANPTLPVVKVGEDEYEALGIERFGR